MAASRPTVGDDGRLAYSVFQQGAGPVNAVVGFDERLLEPMPINRWVERE